MNFKLAAAAMNFKRRMNLRRTEVLIKLGGYSPTNIL